MAGPGSRPRVCKPKAEQASSERGGRRAKGTEGSDPPMPPSSSLRDRVAVRASRKPESLKQVAAELALAGTRRRGRGRRDDDHIRGANAALAPLRGHRMHAGAERVAGTARGDAGGEGRGGGAHLHAARALRRLLHAGGRARPRAGAQRGAGEERRDRGDGLLLCERVGLAGRDHRRGEGVRLRHPEMNREDFPHAIDIQTRWNDNDVYGHVNNVVYYAYFDTVINRYLIDEGGLDLHGSVIGVCVESQCRYLESAAYPDALDAGLRVARVGTSSITYQIGIFRGETL